MDTIVNFYEEVEDRLLRYAVIIAKTDGQYVFCKHKSRNTLEVPGCLLYTSPSPRDS